jgi:hypothetical protein
MAGVDSAGLGEVAQGILGEFSESDKVKLTKVNALVMFYLS